MRNLVTLIVLGVLPMCVVAQDWTPEQLAVIEDMESCFDAWDAAHEAQDYALWSEPCLAENHAAFYWAATDGGLWTDRDWERGLSNKWFNPDSKSWWQSLRPLRVYIHGDIALVYYNPIWMREDKAGKMSNPAQWNLDVLRYENGSWRFVGGMAAPAVGN